MSPQAILKMERDGSKTNSAYWDKVWQTGTDLRLPRGLFVSNRDIQRLLKARIKPGMRVLEIGFAPGNMLAWVAKALGAQVAGVDFSETGVRSAWKLFEVLQIPGDLRCEDIRVTTFPPGSFDLVYSQGFIEHFIDPTEMVRRHVLLLKPGGRALITIPNYGGIYGTLQRFFDPENLDIHNLNIMRPGPLARLAPSDLACQTAAYPAGRISPWVLSLHKRWPLPAARIINHLVNLLGLLQPFDIGALAPMLVLEMGRVEEWTNPRNS
ncbi:MAG: class I SAM-dependent methyltransferase [Deltaproteobacteria bacterium]|nr:class I SAM-dependent methyltransferase [Deltaproteobacteria bacterium]